MSMGRSCCHPDRPISLSDRTFHPWMAVECRCICRRVPSSIRARAMSSCRGHPWDKCHHPRQDSDMMRGPGTPGSVRVGSDILCRAGCFFAVIKAIPFCERGRLFCVPRMTLLQRVEVLAGRSSRTCKLKSKGAPGNRGSERSLKHTLESTYRNRI